MDYLVAAVWVGVLRPALGYWLRNWDDGFWQEKHHSPFFIYLFLLSVIFIINIVYILAFLLAG